MYLKIFLILTILVFAIAVTMYAKRQEVFTLVNSIRASDEGDKGDKGFKKLVESIEEGKVRKLAAILTEEQASNLPHVEGKVVYYFPGKCPEYKDEIYIKTTVNGMEKYFLPETHTVVVVNEEHEWTKDPSDYDMRKK